MLEYNVNENQISNTRAKLLREYARAYNKIQRGNMSEQDKVRALKELNEEIKEKMEIIKKLSTREPIPEEVSKFIEVEYQTPEFDDSIIKALVDIYAGRIEGLEGEEKAKVEEGLRNYFTEHYKDLFLAEYNVFLSNFDSRNPLAYEKEGDLFSILRNANVDPERFVYDYGAEAITVQEGLVAMENSIIGGLNKVYYATPKGINDRIDSLYGELQYFEGALDRKDSMSNDRRRTKEAYIKYAAEHGIDIENESALEIILPDPEKIQGIAKYIARKLEARGINIGTISVFEDELTKRYSEIMNLSYYNFADLNSVQSLIGEGNLLFDELKLNIRDESITQEGISSYDIAYGTPEFLKTEYEKIMSEVRTLHSENAFAKNEYEVKRVNRRKEALRRYISENGIQGVDISIPEVPVDMGKVELIADAIIKKYGKNISDEDKAEIKASIQAKIEARYAELVTECQAIELEDLIGEDLGRLTNDRMAGINSSLYFRPDFAYLEGFIKNNDVVVYGTEEAIKENIKILDEKIATGIAFDEKRQKKVLENYARENGMLVGELREVTDFSYNLSSRLYLPEDPTARKKIRSEDTVMDIMLKLSEGIPGAIVGVRELMQVDETGGMLLLGLDDMNIRGSQIWEIYKYYCGEDAEKFAELVSSRNEDMIQFVNENLARVGGEKAVVHGASFDRSTNPKKYRFTPKEVEELREARKQREERKNQEIKEEVRVKLSEKKNRGKKHAQAIKDKRAEYRQKLISKGKKSIGELDDELNELKVKEAEAKELLGRYEGQLPTKETQTEEEI